MTVHMISVGRSMLDSLNDQERLKNLKVSPDLAKAIERQNPQDVLKNAGADKDGEQASRWLASVLAGADDQRRDQPAAERFIALAKAVKPRQWPCRISAELDTFCRVQRTMILGKADTAVLVCSDTAAGLLAGVWNAIALADGDLSRVAYLADPADALGPARGKVFVVRVEGLDASSERGFSQAMKGLGTLGRNLLDSPDIASGDGFRFYLSGGFKAAIPYLIGLAEGMRSAGGEREVNAYVLHETGDSGAIRLPLRRMIASRVAQELSDFDETTGISRTIPRTTLLDGYAYEINGTSRVLTPFGQGLRALFPLAHERLNR